MTVSYKRRYLEKAERLTENFRLRADEYDQRGMFPFENFEELKEEDFLSLTIPKKFGGAGLNLVEFLEIQVKLSQGDAPTALSLGWHLGVILEAAEKENWQGDSFFTLCKKIVNQQVLINQAATERATGSPSRGGLPTTVAVKERNCWIINGTKSFTSMAVALDYSVVTARIEGTEKKGTFLIDHSLPGVEVEETWDSIAMRGTKSDDLVLNDVFIDEQALLFEHKANPLPEAWYLQIPAVYLGIATSARDYAIEFAGEFTPTTLPSPIKDTPEIQRKVGEIELELFKARELLFGVARKWMDQPEQRKNMRSDLAAVKHIVTNSANNVVDLAMRIVGARSLSQTNPLQRHFRDVRAGLHNPPSDDIIISSLGKQAFKAR
ncbi:acyl-CoA dehydrogenase family protein [Alteribacter populi]|uniref:acyl-CoA dehydrogenase family protein n=1 Tax=Alteribacter populi TaxID=2011011 RepID=UPI001E64821A|nr:acyl-CoA dehydrogenase family protein [Alteribacter populi]